MRREPIRRRRRAAVLPLGAVLLLLGTTGTAAAMDFGMDTASIGPLTDEGIPPDYALFWVGPWNLPNGWGSPENHLDAAKESGVTPVIHFYYWGDSISPSCVENGCDGKSRAGWNDLAEGLTQRMNERLGGDPAVIILETEFNKNGAEDSETVDRLLAEKARYFHEAYPASTVVLGFGNWGHSSWGNMDQTMAEADMAGLQAMRGSTRHDVDEYLGAAEKTLMGAERLHDLFGKPVLITDVALSSYPEPEWADHQRDALQAFADRLDAFQEAGVVGIIYRSLYDNPDFDLDNHFERAERHWGLMRADGSEKPALDVWRDMVAGYRSKAPAAEPDPEPEPQPGDDAGADAADDGNPTSITWTLDDDVSETWVEVYLTTGGVTTEGVALVEARIDGAWVPLIERSWGSWAVSTETPTQGTVAFRATLDDGRVVTGPTYAWPDGDVAEDAPQEGADESQREGHHESASEGSGADTPEPPGLIAKVLGGLQEFFARLGAVFGRPHASA